MWMKRYVEQLVEDLEVTLENAGTKLSLFFDASDDTDYFPITDEDEGGILISDLIGMEKFVFPKVDYLNDIEAYELSSIMVKVFIAYGLNPIFWNEVPDKIRYGQLRDYIDHVVYPEKGTLVDLEMCDYLPDHCPFASICPILSKRSTCCGSRRKRA